MLASTLTAAPGITLDETLTFVFDEHAGPTDLIMLKAESRRDFGDLPYFFCRRGGRSWHWPPNANSPDTPHLVVQRNVDTDVRWSALLYQQSPMENGPARLTALWAALPLTVIASRFHAGLGAVDAASERLAFARLEAVTPSPSFIVHEGARLVAFWRLREPIAAPAEPIPEDRSGPWKDQPTARAQRALWNLALRLDADKRAIDPRRQTFACPGTPMPGIFPRRDVTVVLGSDPSRKYDIDEL